MGMQGLKQQVLALLCLWSRTSLKMEVEKTSSRKIVEVGALRALSRLSGEPELLYLPSQAVHRHKAKWNKQGSESVYACTQCFSSLKMKKNENENENDNTVMRVHLQIKGEQDSRSQELQHIEQEEHQHRAGHHAV